MEFHQISPLPSQRQTHFVMTSVSPKLRHKLFHLRFLCTSSSSSSPIYIPEIPSRPSTLRRTVRAKVSDAQLKENWLASLSCPFPQDKENLAGVNEELNAGSEWILGVDPDVSGALALLKTEDCCCSAQIYDSPHLQVLIGRKVRRRLDAKSIVQLLHNLDAPHGTTAYIEQSNPFPQDGKQILLIVLPCFANEGLVEWRFWVWTMDWGFSCPGVFCCSCIISYMEEHF